MKVAIIGSAGVPANYGGFETLAQQLLLENARQDSALDFSVYCSSYNYEKKILDYGLADLRYVNIRPNGVWSILYDIWSVFSAVKHKDDVVLLLGVSGAICLPFIRFFSRIKIITNLDGVESRRKKWSFFARYFLILSEYLAVHFSNEIISDNEGIRNYIFNKYGVTSNVITYGGDHVLLNTITEASLDVFVPNRFYLSVCRIEPENNIEIILESFRRSSDNNIVIIGNWQNSEYGRRLYSDYQNYENIFLFQPVYDQQVLHSFRSKAIGYIHGHSAGGTNPSLVEALFYKIPTFCFDCDFNRFSTFDMAIYFRTAPELCAAIDHKDVSIDPVLFEKVEEVYRWKNIFDAYKSLFQTNR